MFNLSRAMSDVVVTEYRQPIGRTELYPRCLTSCWFAGQASPSNLNPSPPEEATPTPSSEEVGPLFTCIDSSDLRSGFTQNLTAFYNQSGVDNIVSQYSSTVNMTAAGELMAGLMTAVNLSGISSDYNQLQNILNEDVSALGDSLNTLFADFNYSSVASILASAPSDDDNLGDIAAAVLTEIGNTLNVTTVGQFLVNVSSTAQLPAIGGW